MKKNYLYALSAALVAMCGACSNDDEPNGNGNEVNGQPVSNGSAYILNQGNMSNKIEGMMSVLDEKNSTISNSVFQTANKRSLGDTPQCGIAYGSKIYVGVYVSNTIEVIDRYTYKSIKQISLQGSDKGTQPRSMVAKDGKVYVSMYDGYVARLDTVSMDIDASVKVGPNPEKLAIYNDRIYVPNSDGMNWAAGYGETASVVTLQPFAVEKTITVPLNPSQFMTDGSNLYLLSLGNYGDIDGAVYKMETEKNDAGEEVEVFKSVGAASMAAIGNGNIYLINAPWGKPVSYAKYEISTGNTASMDFKEVSYPSGINVDTATGSILIGAIPLESGAPSYILPGTLCEYDRNGTYKKTYNIGVGPAVIFF